ncbi:MAG: energy-coupling factor transporter transmembrane protein EcfT [Actinomycetota bacterium]|jgi:biotin transport system permease protein|nr:energy-coupling factor transporter transmembrane protein EcfT [Actinomycetota bacterium]
MAGVYVPGASPLHRAPPAAKLVALALAALGLLQLQAPLPLALALAACLAMYAVARIPGRMAVHQIRPALLVLGAIFAAHALIATPADGAVVVLRLVTLILLAALVTMTTRITDMLDVIERACRPLARVGVDPAKVGLVLALSIRFIPVLADQAKEIREAQRARGAHRAPRPLLVPLLIKTLRLAHDLGEALDARGFEGAGPAGGGAERRRRA